MDRGTGDRVGRGEQRTDATTLPPFELGYLLGILAGEGHFGGDGRQPHVTLRMHTRHVDLFVWLVGSVPGSKLYGPYHHGGRDYYQWMVRGTALREHLWPLLRERLGFVDGSVRDRIVAMAARYGLPLEVADAAAPAGEAGSG